MFLNNTNAMNSIFDWDGWMALSVIVQLAVFVPAFIMILYNLRKDRRAFKPKLQLKYLIETYPFYNDSEERAKSLFRAQIIVEMINVCPVPIQIEECYISVGGSGIGIAGFTDTTILPGEKKLGGVPIFMAFLDAIEQEAQSETNAPIYIEVQTPFQVIKERIKLNYGAFLHECRRIILQGEKEYQNYINTHAPE